MDVLGQFKQLSRDNEAQVAATLVLAQAIAQVGDAIDRLGNNDPSKTNNGALYQLKEEIKIFH